ncbi:MAG: cupin domain-containing protein [Bacteroidia bacterium]|nr:cupin domain-containing protein [Bacteroidia bacterium]
MYKTLTFSLVFFLFFSSAMIGQEEKSDPDLATFELSDMLKKLDESGRPWTPVMQGQNVLTGVYRLKAGTEDKQSPHATDEVYYAVSGKAKFRVGEEVVEVKAGSILFVKAEASHQFFDIEEDLVLVVFFDK